MSEILPFFGLSKRGYLQMLCNKYGDFKVAVGWKNKEGIICWSKHRSVLSCWESEEGLRFLDKVNNRSGIGCELRIDTDPENEETPEQSFAKFNSICDELDGKKIYKYLGFSSGSRGYHIHIFQPNLVFMNNLMELKKFIVGKFKGDLLKAGDNTLLTLEWAENNKTGKQKIHLRGDYNWMD